MHDDPERAVPDTHERQFVGIVSQVAQGDVHMHYDPESTVPVTQERQLVAVVSQVWQG
jgi:hypothetical protein